MKQKQPKFSGILVVAVLMVLVLFIVSLSPLLAASGSKDTTYSEIYYYFENQQVTSFRLDLGTGSLEFDQVEEGMVRGSINLGYQVIDTKPYRAILEDAARKEVMAFLGRIDSNKARLSRVFLTGGGASFYQQALIEKLPGYKIETVQNSVMGNARGYWLSGCDDFDI